MSGFLSFLTPGVGSALGAGANLLGGIFGMSGQEQANAANAAQAMNQINFQSSQAAQDREFNAEQAGYNRDFQVNAADTQFRYNTALMNQAQGFDASQADLARQFNAAQAQQQMDFQWKSQAEAERYNQAMSSTAYQRGVADMKAAGINPILAAGQGAASSPSVGVSSGAMATSPSPSSPGGSVGLPSGSQASFSSVPSGAAARFENPNVSLQTGISGAVSSAVNISKLGAELQQIAANIDNTQADTLLKSGQAAQAASATHLNDVSAAKAIAEQAKLQGEAGLIPSMQKEIDANAAAHMSASRASDAVANFNSAQAALTQQKSGAYGVYGDSVLGNQIQSLVDMARTVIRNTAGGGSDASQGPPKAGNAGVIDVFTGERGRSR